MTIKMGDVFYSKSYGKFEVTEYMNARCVKILFYNTGGITTASAGNIRNGRVKDVLAKDVFGVGCIGSGEFKSRLPNNGSCTKEYSTWSSMLFRCYGNERDESTLRSYKDCIVCEDWHNFQNFAQWCQTQPEMLYKDSSLDKDIRVKGNRIYSPETCCFVPSYINTAVTGIKHQNSTGKAGVWKFKDSYVSEITLFGSKSNLGHFETLEAAEYIRNRLKEAYIGGLAEIFKDRISAEVYTKLKEWYYD